MLPETSLKKLSNITLNILGNNYKVKDEEITPETSLNEYLRNVLNLKGTKNMCFEGGCGTCIVVARKINPETKKEDFFAINSCLVPVLACKDWKIDTVEGIGGPPAENYHAVQKALADFNGTQCGYCSPGMVMNMYALYETGDLTMEQVENSFGGNICRCTGYRPILAAFKSLCKDADPALLGTYPDIEDTSTCKKAACERKCATPCSAQKIPFHLSWTHERWVKVYYLKDLLKEIKTIGNTTYRVVCGNTGKGVYRETEKPSIYIDIKDVEELLGYQITNDKLVLGANISLTSAIGIFHKLSTESSTFSYLKKLLLAESNKFSYLKKLADHIDLIANVPVRNIGSLAGNLMLKHQNKEFPSDIFLVLETVGATLTLVDADGAETTVKLEDFVKTDMKTKLIKNIILPSLDDSYKYESYKIMPRAQNAHALVNAGFLFKFKENLIESATIVYGSINPDFIHATNTESYLAGKDLFDNTVIQTACKTLASEISPDHVLPDPEPEFRKKLAISLFYKTVLSLAPDSKVTARNKSGGEKLQRPISKGTQEFDTNKSMYPVTKAIPKIEALAQTSGQAEYIADMPNLPNQLHGQLILADAPPSSVIQKIDASKALAHPDIIAFFKKDDIPGENNFMSKDYFPIEEEIFCSGVVKFYSQPIGLLVGKTKESLLEASSLIDVQYTPAKDKPLLTIADILEAKATDKIIDDGNYPAKSKGKDVKHVIKGIFDIRMQYHYHMETQCCRVIPTEDGLDVYPSSQWMDLSQIAIAKMLKIPANKININVRRCGGGFGAKISRNSLLSCAASLAAWKLRKPVSVSMSMEDNCDVMGKRYPLYCDYEVAVNDEGIIQYLNADMYSDLGQGGNEKPYEGIIEQFKANYDSATFSIKTYYTKTDVHANTWCRAPGTTEGLAAIESIMDHVAYTLNIDPIKLRMENITKQTELLNYIEELKDWADIDKRRGEIEKFNQENRWKKKGLSLVPMAYEFHVTGPFTVVVSIFHHDGSVAIYHGGIEIGQGINTKAAQVCAFKFGIPMEKVIIRPSNSSVTSNCANTGGSVTSEAICYGIIKACDELLERLAPYKKATWEETVSEAFRAFENLSAYGSFNPSVPDAQGYTIFGICATEVLLDVLTGQYFITRVDLIEDTGDSMSPVIDIGQVEGAFVMGIGYYTSEQLVYNDKGKLLTNRTWNYKPPGAKDIPIDFRVKFPKNNPNYVGVLKSKATGEPPLCLSVSVPLAIRNAVASARSDADGTKPKWYPFSGPTTVEDVFMNCLTEYTQFVL